MKNYLKNNLKNRIMWISLVFVVVIISSIYVIADEELPAKKDSYPEVRKIIPTDPAPQWVIDKVNNYIISFVGEDYFEEHFELVKNSTLSGTSKSGERYLFVYNYTHNLKDNPDDDPYQVVYTFNLRADSNGELVALKGIKYRGPNRPYQFLVSKQEALSKAIEYGLKEPFFGEPYIYYGIQGYNFDTPVEDGTYGWLIQSKNCTPGRNVYVLFIDVDNSNIITTKSIETTCKGEELSSFNKGGINESNMNISTKEVDEEEKDGIFKRIINWIRSLCKRDDAK